MNERMMRFRTAAVDVALRRSENSSYSERMSVLIWAMLAVVFVTLVVSTIFGAGTEPTRMAVVPLAVIGAGLAALVILEFAKLITGAAR
ncbi:hypothetical protein [Rhodoplanes roseus]|uniref:Uncharacterized protein n=1 Tax=Rhodoplanes roseus TaxID=29409 RepID=A0A327KNW5_9BRAD|nr:hypothetical protein [Rhodoplanes roseus]RAI40041.1 hypothetical protein CH341_24610 [Rhodoplanes roseus]